MFKFKFINNSLIILVMFLVLSCSNYKTNENTKTVETFLELPNYDISNDVVIYHNNYSLVYLEQFEQSQWVAYCVESFELEKNFERTDNFKQDPLVISETANDNDYKGSGYDRGHLMPAAVCTWDSIAMYESFYYSNVSPQNASFNRGVWSRLEDLERDLALKFGKVWVVITPLFDNVIEYIGENKVAVPNAYGRAFIIRDGENYKGIAFILTNEKKESDFDIINNASISIDSLEVITGLDLFFNLNDNIEPIVEKTLSKEIFN